MKSDITTADIQRMGRPAWEYFAIHINSIDAETLKAQLDGYGKKGWGLMAVDNGLFVFKRQTGLMYD